MPTSRILNIDRDGPMKNELRGISVPTGEAETSHRNDWASFLLLAFVGLPVTMVALIAAYGFIVWFLQILFFGPPS